MSRNLKQWVPLIVVLAVSSALIGAIAVADALRPAPGPNTAEASAPRSLFFSNYGLTPDLALLSEPASANDTPPTTVVESWDPVGRTGIIPDSVRRLGSISDAEAWVGRDVHDNVCLLVNRPEDGSAASCAPIKMFDVQGMLIGMTTQGKPEIFVHLLPDRALPEGVDELRVEAPGLVSVRPGVERGTVIEVPTSSGPPLRLTVFQ